jgi:CRISPR-associated protein Csb1
VGGKFARLIVSEIIGYRAYFGVKTSSRIDPAQISLQAGPVFEDGHGSWVLENLDGNLALVGGDGRPSRVGHGNITPTITNNCGVTIERAVQTTVLSLPALRRLRFSVDGQKEESSNSAARSYLAALGILGATLAREQGCDLRSRCVLIPTQTFKWEMLDKPDSPLREFVVNTNQAESLYNEAYEDAEELKFKFEDKLTLRPSNQLAEMIKRSQDIINVSVGTAEE